MACSINELVDSGLAVVGNANSPRFLLKRSTVRSVQNTGPICCAKAGALPEVKKSAVQLENPAVVNVSAVHPADASVNGCAPAATATVPVSNGVRVDRTSADSVQAVQQKMEQKAAALGLKSAKFIAVEPNYYEQELEWRRNRVSANSADEMCKSVVMENTKLGDDAEPGRVRFVLVLVQYVAKLHKEKLMRAVQSMETKNGLAPMARKAYNMRLLDGQACVDMTGFGHNAVTPLGLDIPVVLSDKITQLPSGCFWLGGGHADLKIRLSTEEVQSVLKATSADITS